MIQAWGILGPKGARYPLTNVTCLEIQIALSPRTAEAHPPANVPLFSDVLWMVSQTPAVAVIGASYSPSPFQGSDWSTIRNTGNINTVHWENGKG